MTHSLGKFQHSFIDWLCIDAPFLNLRTELQLDRPQLAKLLDISPHSIRRYETENKAPKWYYMLLRVLCGDLSIFGACWDDCRIQPHDRKLKAPEIDQPVLPVELNAMYNRQVHAARKESALDRAKAERLGSENVALKALILELEVKIDFQANTIARLKAHDQGIKKGTVVPLFKS
jgi:transcriptional regulator with XRE-family HTH domain